MLTTVRSSEVQRHDNGKDGAKPSGALGLSVDDGAALPILDGMPHCVLEYSANVVDAVDAKALFAELHAALAEVEAFPVDDLKSRAVRLTDTYIGDGAATNAFVHLRFSLLSGRDISVRQRIVQVCSKVLSAHFARSMATLQCRVSVEVFEMDRSTYAKL